MSLIFFAILCVVSSNVLMIMFVVKVKKQNPFRQHSGIFWKQLEAFKDECSCRGAATCGCAGGRLPARDGGREKISAGLSKKHP